MTNSTTNVVTCFLRNRGEVLLCRRSEAVGSYTGQWGAVAGHAEGAPDALAREEIVEETGLLDAVTFVRAGDPFTVDDDERGTRWRVHPYLFDCEHRAVETNEETAEYEWVVPTEIRRRETVPDLWTAYERVAPTVETVREDTEHGSATISVYALAVLRDRAGVFVEQDGDGDGWDELADLARELRDARPSMTAIENRVNRAMCEVGEERTPATVEHAAQSGIERALDADADAAANAATKITNVEYADAENGGPRVLTFSRSGTVLETLRQANPAEVLIAESRPAREGVAVAETLVEDTSVTLAVDAALAHLLAERAIDAVLVGADTVLSDGTVLNKVGTRVAALAAAREGVPCYAVAANDKIAVEGKPRFEDGDPEDVYDGDTDLTVANPTFDATPSDLLAGLVTENGVLDAGAVESVAEAHRARRDWSEE